jgi:hypothetical protein
MNTDQHGRAASLGASPNAVLVISKGIQALFIGAVVLVALWQFYIPAMKSSTISESHPKAKVAYALFGATAYFIMYVYILFILRRTRHQRKITGADQRHFAVVTWFYYIMLFFSLLPSLYVAGVPQAIFGFMTTRFPGLNQRIASVGSSIITWLVTGVLSGVAYDIIKKLSVRLMRGVAKGSK